MRRYAEPLGYQKVDMGLKREFSWRQERHYKTVRPPYILLAFSLGCAPNYHP